MSGFSRIVAGATSAIAMAAVCVAAGTGGAVAEGADSQPRMQTHVRGGAPDNKPYMVKLVVGRDNNQWVCTGESIAPEWILTARHCTDSPTWGNVYFQDSPDRSLQAPVPADYFTWSKVNDVGLIHLKRAKSVSQYAPLTDGYTPKEGDKGTVSGFGNRSGGVAADGLYTANVKVLGPGKDLYGGSGIHIEGVDGSAQKGDSGGALIVNGKLVGLDSRGDYNDSGTGITARSYWANITASRDWIKQTAGV